MLGSTGGIVPCPRCDITPKFRSPTFQKQTVSEICSGWIPSVLPLLCGCRCRSYSSHVQPILQVCSVRRDKRCTKERLKLPSTARERSDNRAWINGLNKNGNGDALINIHMIGVGKQCIRPEGNTHSPESGLTVATDSMCCRVALSNL